MAIYLPCFMTFSFLSVFVCVWEDLTYTLTCCPHSTPYILANAFSADEYANTIQHCMEECSLLLTQHIVALYIAIPIVVCVHVMFAVYSVTE